MGSSLRQSRSGAFFTRRFYRALCFVCVYAHIVLSSIRIYDLTIRGGEMSQGQILAFVVFNLSTQFVILAMLLVTKKAPPE